MLLEMIISVQMDPWLTHFSKHAASLLLSATAEKSCLQKFMQLHISSTVHLTIDWSWRFCQGCSWGHSHSSAETFSFEPNANQNSYGVILDELLINQAALFLYLHKWEREYLHKWLSKTSYWWFRINFF